LLALAAAWAGYSCATDAAGSSSNWAGTADTLASGRVVVSNPDAEVWTDETRWTATEDLRIGTLDGTGPDVFGSIAAFEVDDAGRLYVYERQALELRIFDASGAHLRTVGRSGGGPGEFGQVAGMTWAPDGMLWVIDPGNSRISVFDTSGTFVTSHPTAGGFIIMPWPGGFDAEGRFYNVGFNPNADANNRMVLIRYSAELEALDTLTIPRDNVERAYFELSGDGRFMRAGVPYQPNLQWRFTPDGFATVETGAYRIERLSWTHDTLVTITKAYTPLSVTDQDIEQAVADLEWFTRQGGQIEYDKFPDQKPAVAAFFVDDLGYFWAAPITGTEDERRVFDVFDPEGRYLGRVRLPFRVESSPRPAFRGGYIYAVTQDDLEVPYLVRARLNRP
jgi:sugar lactone lactonase YvrE